MDVSSVVLAGVDKIGLDVATDFIAGVVSGLILIVEVSKSAFCVFVEIVLDSASDNKCGVWIIVVVNDGFEDKKYRSIKRATRLSAKITLMLKNILAVVFTGY